jgi:hypothetical protein
VSVAHELDGSVKLAAAAKSSEILILDFRSQIVFVLFGIKSEQGSKAISDLKSKITKGKQLC